MTSRLGLATVKWVTSRGARLSFVKIPCCPLSSIIRISRICSASTTVVGPSNTAVFTKPAQVRVIKAGDVVVIPAGVYHGWSEIPDHVQYVSVRPDVERVLPGGYINPTLKK